MSEMTDKTLPRGIEHTGEMNGTEREAILSPEALELLEAWLRGYGAVPINNLMEDVATRKFRRRSCGNGFIIPKGFFMTAAN
jgi:hypothetical protein